MRKADLIVVTVTAVIIMMVALVLTFKANTGNLNGASSSYQLVVIDRNNQILLDTTTTERPFMYCHKSISWSDRLGKHTRVLNKGDRVHLNKLDL